MGQVRKETQRPGILKRRKTNSETEKVKQVSIENFMKSIKIKRAVPAEKEKTEVPSLDSLRGLISDVLKKKSNVAVKIKKSEPQNEVQIHEKVEQRLTADSEQVSESEADGPSSSDSSDSEYTDEERQDSQ